MAASLIAVGLGLTSATTAFAQPGQPEPPVPPPAPVAAPVDGEASPPAVKACAQFARALRVSSAYYNKFAASIAGEGAYVNYQDPTVASSNVDGRTALRKSAAEALSASTTPGLQPEIAGPMRTWSLLAAKLLVVMGVNGDGNVLNTSATELNDAAGNTQKACASAGAQPVIRDYQPQP